MGQITRPTRLLALFEKKAISHDLGLLSEEMQGDLEMAPPDLHSTNTNKENLTYVIELMVTKGWNRIKGKY
jgi:hypothetical protein